MDKEIALLESELHEIELVEGFQDQEKHFYIRGVFATIEKINNNKRIYPRKLWEREVEKYQTQIQRGTVNTLMEWEHPTGRSKVDPKNAVAKITKLWIEGDYVMGEAVIFDNAQADTLKSMIIHGVKISVSSRATGKVGQGGRVQEFNLVTFDIVTTPSDQGATMSGVYESEEDDVSNQNIEDQMANDVLTENLVSILRYKNSEIEDLKAELDMLRESYQDLKESQSSQIIESQYYLEDYDPTINDMRRSLYESEIESELALSYTDDQHYYHGNTYDEERREYTLRNIYVGYNDDYDYRHQDVSSTLRDNDYSGGYSSGEDENPRTPSLVRNSTRPNQVGVILGADVNNGDEIGGVGGRMTPRGETEVTKPFTYSGTSPMYALNYYRMNESKKPNVNRFLVTPNHLL